MAGDGVSTSVSDEAVEGDGEARPEDESRSASASPATSEEKEEVGGRAKCWTVDAYERDELPRLSDGILLVKLP